MASCSVLPNIDLNWLLERVAEDGCGCLVWRRHCGQGRYPAAKIAGRHWYVRRLLWTLTRGRSVPKGKDVAPSCDNELCVHPDHLVLRTPSARTGGVPKSAQHRAATALAMRKRFHLSDEVMRDIRESDESAAAIDRRHGLFTGHAAQIRRGRVRRDLSSPFAGLWRPAQ